MTDRLRSFFTSRHRYLEAFLIGALTASTFMVLYLVLDGAFTFYGDFNVQQIPFYIEANRAVRSGAIFWNATTDLGVNFIGSYSFYLVGSPFFWLTTLLPLEWVGYSFGYMYILKFACATLTGYAFTQRFIKNKDYALIAALLYAFSGYGIYNIFFNHFHEALVFFPLLPLGMELAMKDKKHGAFAFAVFINAFVNYYFFFGEVIFCVIYFIVRAMSKDWNMSAGRFLLLALESVIGLGMSAVLLVPALMSAADVSRSTNFIDGWKAIFYQSEQRYGLIIESFFFPPDIPARPNFFPDSDSKWASTAGWMPVFSMVGVIAYLQCKKKDWLKRIIWVSIFFAFIPFLNSAFSFFNYGYYSRWFYMPILMMALATAKSIEDDDVDLKRGFKWTALITLFITLLIGFIPKKVTDGDGNLKWAFGVYAYADRFFIYVAIAFASLGLLALLLWVIKRSSKWFTASALICVILITAIYANVFIMIGRAHSYDREWMITTLINEPDGIEFPDEGDDTHDYRIDTVHGSMDNIGLFWGESSVHAFHSIVPESVFDYYNAIGVQRGVGSRPEWSHQALRYLLSVKWLVDPDNDSADDINKYSGWTYVTEINGYGIYKNDNYVPMGFVYENFITRASFETLSEAQKEKIMLLAIVLEESQAEKYADLLTMIPLSDDDVSLCDRIGGGLLTDDDVPYIAAAPSVPSMTTAVLTQAASTLRENSSSSFKYTTTGFESVISLKKDNLVFFSVPFDEGWSATVNGQEAQIEQVSVGFMAVKVPAGEDNRIVFTYMTPGLKKGALTSAASVAVLACYLITVMTVKAVRKHRRKSSEEYETEDEPLLKSSAYPFMISGESIVSDEQISFDDLSANAENERETAEEANGEGEQQ